jgi:glyoxylase-like metal-dependent hydrolase (beta-lactamase superfamily II)
MALDNTTFHFTIGHFNCLAINDRESGNSNCLLIDTGQHKVLLESGSGDGMVPPGLLVERLAAAGVSPNMIDIVLISHADADHIVGSVDAHGNLLFPQARFVMSPEEWAFWSSDAQRLQPNALFDDAALQWANHLPKQRLPYLRQQLTLMATGAEVVPGICSVALPGHTPGMIGTVISSGGEQLYFIGDVVYDLDLSADGRVVGNPEFHAVVDFDPVQARTTRYRLFAQAANERTLLMAYHTPFPGLGYIEQAAAGWRWAPWVAAA